MSFPSDPQAPWESDNSAQPSTREIPVVPAAGAAPLPPHPGATVQTPVQAAEPMDTPQATGPVDFVPGLPGPGTPPPPPAPGASNGAAETPTGAPAPTWPDTLESDSPAADRPAKERAPRDRSTLAGAGLAVLSLVLLELGLSLHFGPRSLWVAVPLWSAFATVSALLALLAFVASSQGSRLRPGAAWKVAAGGLVGLAVFWLLVVLPHADTNRGFVLTAALAAMGAGLWIGAGRKA
ncbi:MAG: hypothetical protein ACXVXS_07315 [Blastococcus sp.]